MNTLRCQVYLNFTGTITDNMLLADSSGLCIDHPTPEERIKIWTETHDEWGKAVSQEQYIGREIMRMDTALERDGGITHWVLVERSSTPNAREIYCSCESLRKKVLVAQNGKLEKGSTHGLGSVWCSPQHRRKGYGSRMLKELGKILRTWQVDPTQSFLARVPFSMLFSDIGKEYYAKFGWHPFDSSQLVFPASQAHRGLANILYAADVAKYCFADCGHIESDMEELTEHKPVIALLPDAETMQWYFAREDFLGNCLFGRTFDVKGAVCGIPGSRVWAIFYRAFCSPPGVGNSKNAFYILRLSIEDADQGSRENARLFRAVIQMAMSEAEACNINKVTLWNPTPLVKKLAYMSLLDYEEEHREKESIPCFMWYGEGSGTAQDILWYANDKHVWC